MDGTSRRNQDIICQNPRTGKYQMKGKSFKAVSIASYQRCHQGSVTWIITVSSSGGMWSC